MSSTSSVKMTEEQEKFLKSLEEEFKDRYTEKDEEYQKVVNKQLPMPPVIENWTGRGHGNRYRYRNYNRSSNYCYSNNPSYREHREYRDHREQREHREYRDHREQREYREYRDHREQGEYIDHRGYRRPNSYSYSHNS